MDEKKSNFEKFVREPFFHWIRPHIDLSENNFYQNLRKLNGIFAFKDRIFAGHFLANESVEVFQNL